MKAPCGTNAGYQRHYREGEKGCPACLAAAAAYQRDRYYRRRVQRQPSGRVPVIGVIRRIQALQRLGWTRAELSARLGKSHAYLSVATSPNRKWVNQATHDAIDRLYQELCMTPGMSVRAKVWAARRGYVPPLAWDDIDNPDEHPTGWEYRPADRGELLLELDRFNAGISEVCRTLKVSRDALEKWCERHDYMPVYSRILSREITNPASPFSGNKHRKVS